MKLLRKSCCRKANS